MTESFDVDALFHIQKLLLYMFQFIANFFTWIFGIGLSYILVAYKKPPFQKFEREDKLCCQRETIRNFVSMKKNPYFSMQ